MPDQSRSQETHFSGPAIYATTPAPPPSYATGAQLLSCAQLAYGCEGIDAMPLEYLQQ